MRLLNVRCPSCGAGLVPPTGDDRMDCTYCGTTVLLHRPSGPSEAGIPQARVSPAPILLVIAASGVIAVAGGVMVVAMLLSSSESSDPPVPPGVGRNLPVIAEVTKTLNELASAASAHHWMGQGPVLLVDVDGDGDEDVVGRGRKVTPDDVVSLLAVEAASGELLWESAPLGTYTDTYRGPLAWDGEQFLFADTVGGVWAIGPDGTTRWTRRLGESIEGFCGGGVARSKAGGRVRLSAEAAEPTTDECVAVASDSDDEWAGWSAHGWANYEGPEPPRDLDGLKARAVLPLGDDVVLAAHRNPGTRVPTVARMGGGAVLWSTELPPGNGMAADEGEPDLLQVDGDAIYAVVTRRSGTPPLLVRLDAATGDPVWESPLPDRRGTWVLTALAAGEGRVFVSTWGAIEVFDAATGEFAYRLGVAL